MSTDMSGKICIVTGANSGIGTETALGLAKMGAHVVMACRDLDRSKPALERVQREAGADRAELMALDLSSLDSVRSFAEAFKAKHDQLHVLVNNAGVVPTKRETTRDGFEMQFGVNHLAHFLLTNLLLDTLKASAPARVVTVSSVMHVSGSINFDDLQSEQKYSAIPAYRQSKLANILFAFELARRLEGTGVTSNALHPGVVNTGIGRHAPFFLQPVIKLYGLFTLSPEQGAATSLYCATAPELEGVTGKYFDKCAESKCPSKCRDAEVATKLWSVSEELTGLA